MDAQKVIIEFGTSVAANTFDYVVSDALLAQKEKLNGPVKIELDFRKTTFIDIVSSQQLISTVIAFRKRNWLPILRLPKEKSVRDFWRLWEYPDAFKKATGVGFSRLVLPEEHYLLNEDQTTYRADSMTKIHQSGTFRRQRANNFFGFFSEDIDSNSPTLLADREAGRWSLGQIQDVLRKHLGDRADYMPSRIVFEAIFNAAKHPGARIVQSASFHNQFVHRDDDGSDKDDGHFTVFFWDDGKSIVRTLQAAIADGINIREDHPSGYDKNYLFKSKNLIGEGAKLHETIDSASIEPNTKELDLLLASALFPGITSRPESLRSDPHGFNKALLDADINLTKRGMGLYVLMNAVVDVLGGTIGIRTDKFYLHVEKLGPKLAKQAGADTKLSVTRLPENLPNFEGNLIVVRVKSKHS